MTTARQMLNAHQDTFWNVKSQDACDAWMAKDAQLTAYAVRQSCHPVDRAPYALERAFEHDRNARHLMNINDMTDQFYA